MSTRLGYARSLEILKEELETLAKYERVFEQKLRSVAKVNREKRVPANFPKYNEVSSAYRETLEKIENDISELRNQLVTLINIFEEAKAKRFKVKEDRI